MKKYNSPIIGLIELTAEREEHILTNHPGMKAYLKEIEEACTNPDEIRKSKFYENALLFYKYFASIKRGKYVAVTIKTGERNFILTAYITDRIRAGEVYEKN